MKLMNIEEYRMYQFTEQSRPTRRQIIRWIQQDELPGRAIGGKQHFVMVNERALTIAPLVDRLLGGA